MSAYAAVILAAGYSSRMGALKPLLPIAGVPAVRRIAGIAKSAGAAPVVVTGHRAPEVSGALGGIGAVVVENKNYGEGMFSSVLAGVKALPPGARAFFLLPADCCAASAGTLVSLMREFSASRGESVIYPVFDGKRGHPPLLPRKFAPALLGYGGEGGAKGCLESLPGAELAVPDAGILLDMDTPRAYAALLRFTGHLPDMSDGAAGALLKKYGTPADIVSHGEDVAALCGKIAARLPPGTVDAALLRFAALTHDISRREPEHAARGAELLLREGYPDAAMLAAGHMEPPGEGAGAEAEILFLADKLSRRGKIVSPEDTMAAMRGRLKGDAEALAAMERRMSACSMLLNKYKKAFDIASMYV